MTTLTADAVTTRTVTATHGQAVPLTFSRVLQVEFRKLTSTLSNNVLLLLLAAGAVLIAVVCTLNYTSIMQMGVPWMAFAAIINLPATFLVGPLVILLVTSEWSTRSTMTTFTLVPRRSLVIAAKAVVTVVVTLLVWAFGVVLAAVVNVIGSAITNSTASWDLPVLDVLGDASAFLLLVLSAFALALLLHNGPAAIVGFLAIPTALTMAAQLSPKAASIIQWIDLTRASQVALYDMGGASGTQWAHLATAVTVWIVIPLVLGWIRTLRREAS